MLFDIVKLFELDIAAKIEAVKASFELPVEQATDHVKQVSQQAPFKLGNEASTVTLSSVQSKNSGEGTCL